MDPSEFVTFSGQIVARGSAGARSAVSRAYYGVFHLAIALLDEFDCAPPRNGNSHALVPQFLLSSPHPEAQTAGTLLGDLHSDRIKADYRLDNPQVENLQFAQGNVETAVQVQSSLYALREACADASVRDQLIAGIEELLERLKLSGSRS